MDTQMKSKNISAFTLAVGRTVNGIKTTAKKFREAAPILTCCMIIGTLPLASVFVAIGVGLLNGDPAEKVNQLLVFAQMIPLTSVAIGMLAEGAVRGKKYLDRASNAAEQAQKEKRSLQNN